MGKRVPVKHIGYMALCDGKHYDDSVHRIDLGLARYKQLGVRERFKDEDPYRVCKRCLGVIGARENVWRRSTWRR